MMGPGGRDWPPKTLALSAYFLLYGTQSTMRSSLTRPVFLFAALAGFTLTLHAQPAPQGILPLSELKAGQHGEVWTVFHGSQPEPFTVEVSGVVRNALGPGKSLILCQLIDPRVEKMGAVAGMSGSPLYINGKLAGALSYQIQSFETVHFAGFTPAADLGEVGARVGRETGEANLVGLPGTGAAPVIAGLGGYSPLRPVFTLNGLSPQVAGLMQPYFTALGLTTSALGGSLDSNSGAAPAGPLRAGSAVSVALATGDITLAGTGTVSEIDGDRVIAFGHPMMSLGDVELPMCSAEIVTIIPSALESIKIANTGAVIGTITQDRLSAVSGLLGRRPAMIDVDVDVTAAHGAPRTLHFQVARQDQLTPAIIAAGVTQAIVGSNDAGLSNGFRLSSNVTFSPTQKLSSRILYAGPQAFAEGLGEFVKGLSQDLQNPYQKAFPQRVSFTVEPLTENPAVTVDLFQLSRNSAQAGGTVTAQLTWRDFQGAEHFDTVAIPVDPSWIGKDLEVVLAPGQIMDTLTGRPRQISAASLRSFDAYLAAMRQDRATDGFCLAVVERSPLFTDQTASTAELPASMVRVAAAADESRFQQHTALLPLWESHVLTGKVGNVVVRRALQVVD